jgi:hypothetical protein
MIATMRDEPTVSANERQLQILTIMARTMGDVTEKLNDVRVLNQQAVDLLRRLVSEEPAP